MRSITGRSVRQLPVSRKAALQASEGGAALSSDDLDECHGHSHEVDWDGRRIALYHYHATSEYPYTVACFKGTSVRP